MSDQQAVELDVQLEPRARIDGSNGDGASRRSMRRSTAHRPRRRWPYVVVGAVVGTAGSAAVMAWSSSNDDDGAATSEEVQLGNAEVEVRDLVDEVSWSATLAYGDEFPIEAATDGTVLSSTGAGAMIERGDVLVTVDGAPVVVLYGSVPMWRSLDTSTEGADVRQLEANLVLLGFDPDGEVTIDDEFTSATTEMVERWEESLGLDPTGDVPLGRVVVLPGPAVVSEIAAAGASVGPGTTLATVQPRESTVDVVAVPAGDDDDAVVAAQASAGTLVEQGTVLYSLGDIAVPAVVSLDTASAAIFEAFASDDVETIESVLVFTGFDPDGAIVIDDEFDLATAAAIIRWQESVGLPATGSSDPAHYVVLPEALDVAYRVDSVHLGGDLNVGGGQVAMTLAASTLQVTVDVAAADADEFEVGVAVTVELADESTVAAVVVDVGDVATIASDDGEATLTVTIALVDPPDAVITGSVTVLAESSRIDDAVVVPTRALLTLREGGFAVEVVSADGTTQLVGVELGTYDDGVVEIVAGDVSPGDRVVVPA